MAAYVKKVLIFSEMKQGYALKGKSISGVLKAENVNGRSGARFFLTNFNPRNVGEIVGILKVDERETHFQAESAENSDVACQGLTQESRVDCVIALKQGNNVVPIAYATNRANGIADALAQKLSRQTETVDLSPKKVLHTERAERQDYAEIPSYEEFVAATDNYYLKEEACFPPAADETEESEAATNPTVTPYYRKVKKELTTLFETHLPYEPLMNAVPDSVWVKINTPDRRFYVVGVILKGETPKYICYGIPAGEAKGLVPDFKRQNFGQDAFYFLYQDATSGECVVNP